jgi:hypothetical protein
MCNNKHHEMNNEDRLLQTVTKHVFLKNVVILEDHCGMENERHVPAINLSTNPAIKLVRIM